MTSRTEVITYRVTTLEDDPLPKAWDEGTKKPQGFMLRLIRDIIALKPNQSIVLRDIDSKGINRFRSNCIFWFRILKLPYSLEVLTVKTPAGLVAFVFKHITKKNHMNVIASNRAYPDNFTPLSNSTPLVNLTPVAELADATDLKSVETNSRVGSSPTRGTEVEPGMFID